MNARPHPRRLIAPRQISWLSCAKKKVICVLWIVARKVGMQALVVAWKFIIHINGVLFAMIRGTTLMHRWLVSNSDVVRGEREFKALAGG